MELGGASDALLSGSSSYTSVFQGREHLRRWRLAAIVTSALALCLALSTASLHASSASMRARAESREAELLALRSALSRAQTDAHGAHARAQQLAAAAPALHAANLQLADAASALTAENLRSKKDLKKELKEETQKALQSDHTRKVSIDPATPKEAVEKYTSQGMSLILSDEFHDLERTKSIFTFEDMPYGVPGNTGDVNIVSAYTSDVVSLKEGGGRKKKNLKETKRDKKRQKTVLML